MFFFYLAKQSIQNSSFNSCVLSTGDQTDKINYFKHPFSCNGRGENNRGKAKKVELFSYHHLMVPLYIAAQFFFLDQVPFISYENAPSPLLAHIASNMSILRCRSAGDVNQKK